MGTIFKNITTLWYTTAKISQRGVHVAFHMWHNCKIKIP